MIYYGDTKVYLDFEVSSDTEEIIATHNPFCSDEFSANILPNIQLVNKIVLPSEIPIALSTEEFTSMVYTWFHMQGLSINSISRWLDDYKRTLQRALSVLGTKYLDDKPFFPNCTINCIKELEFKLDNGIVIDVPYAFPELSLEVNALVTGRKEKSELIDKIIEQAETDLLDMTGRFHLAYADDYLDIPFASSDLLMVHLCSPIEGDAVRTNIENVHWSLTTKESLW